MKEAIRRQLSKGPAANPKAAEGLRKQLATLEGEISQAAENFLRTVADLLDIVGVKLSAMKRQREHLERELRLAELSAKPKDVVAEVNAITSRLEGLGNDLAKASPARRREVFAYLVERVDLRFSRKQRGKRVECPFLSGEIHLRTGEGSIFGSVSRDDKTAIELFVAGIRGWEAGLWRRLDNGKSGPA